MPTPYHLRRVTPVAALLALLPAAAFAESLTDASLDIQPSSSTPPAAQTTDPQPTLQAALEPAAPLFADEHWRGLSIRGGGAFGGGSTDGTVAVTLHYFLA